MLWLLLLIVTMKISKQQVLSQEETTWGKVGFTSLLHMWVCCSWQQGWNVVGNNGKGGNEDDDGGLERCIIVWDSSTKFKAMAAEKAEEGVKGVTISLGFETT